MTILLEPTAALLVIDVQRGFDDEAHWGEPNNPDAEANIAALAAAWTAAGRPIVRVRHASTSPASPLRPDHPGHAFTPAVADLTPALEIVKSVHSSFHGSPDLHAWLGEHGINQIVVTGIQTNRCCETTARIAGDLGYDVLFAIDATRTFTEGDIAADRFAAVTAANIDGNFGRVVRTADLLG